MCRFYFCYSSENDGLDDDIKSGFIMQERDVSENQALVDSALAEKINAARIAVNVITLFGLFIALFSGVMLGIFNSTVPNAGTADFALGFASFFFGIGVPCLIFQLLVRRAIAQPGLWNQAIVWCYCIILMPIFPIGSAASSVILFAQISWMRTAK